LSKYGIDYYGAAYYGSNTLVDFSAAPFIAVPSDYKTISLSWTTPTGSWSYMRLIRNSYGFAVTSDDGDVLFEDAASTSRVTYVDNGSVPNYVGLKPGHPYYYSIFVKENVHDSWLNAGNAIGISVKDYNTQNNMHDHLPAVITSQVPYDPSVDQNNDFLQRFLKLFALNLDLYRSQTDNVINRYNINDINGLLIPVFMRQFGMRYEPELGLKQSRILLNNAIRLYKNKGSKLGLQEYIKAYGGYDNEITLSNNMMLDQNDSSFEQSIGSWASVNNCTLARHLASDSPTIAPYYEPTSQSNFPNLQAATLQVTTVASGTVELALSGDNANLYGIPVTASTAYTFSGYAQAGSTARSITALIAWYDQNGTLISTSTAGTGVSDTAGSWHRFNKTATSPAGTYFAVPHIKYASSVTSEKHYFDALQFELGSSATAFKEARQIKIVLQATRINEIINPNFASPENGWTVTNGTIAASTNPDDILAVNGSVTNSSEAGEIYASAAGLVTLTSQAMPIFANNDYTFSIYTAAADSGDAPTAITPYISWYDVSNNLINTVQGSPLTATATLVRPFVTATAPSSAVTAKVGVTWTATGAGSPGNGNQIVVDAALFEKSAFVNSYFDGSNGVAQLSDLFWEGTINASRSHYYINRFAVQSRLVSTIPDWINLGSTFELFFAQPNT
jgi:phage tail-like protein